MEGQLMATTANHRNVALKEAMTKTQILDALSESTGPLCEISGQAESAHRRHRTPEDAGFAQRAESAKPPEAPC